MWCFWRESSFHRRDQVAVFRPHGADGEPCAKYWLAAPPWFGDPAEDAAILRRRFRTADSAMRYADKTWPEHCFPKVKGNSE